MRMNEKGERLIEHHVKYKELHGVDETEWMTRSEHNKLHHRLRKEGKCNASPNGLHKISTATQERAIIEIKRMETALEKRWFISAEILGITENTLKALERKGYLKSTDSDGLSYYKSTW